MFTSSSISVNLFTNGNNSFFYDCFICITDKWISNCFEVRNKSIARGDPKQLRPMCDEYGYYLNPRCEVHKNVRFCTCWLAEGYIVKGPSDLIKSCTCFLDHFVAKRTYERTGSELVDNLCD